MSVNSEFRATGIRGMTVEAPVELTPMSWRSWVCSNSRWSLSCETWTPTSCASLTPLSLLNVR